MRRGISLLLLLVCTVSGVSCLLGCGGGAPLSRSFFGVFDTVATLYDYSGDGTSAFEERYAVFERELTRYHRLYDIYNEYEGQNNLATLNAHAGQGPLPLDTEILDLLEYGQFCYTLTGGTVNIALGAVTELWHAARAAETPALPDSQALSAAAEHCAMAGLVIDRAAGTAELTDPAMRLDVGAIAKGYAVERVSKMLENAGASGCVLDVGGNLRAIGTKPDGGGWSCGVRNPYGEGTVYTATLSDGAAVTSGGYERRMQVDGKEYGHIVDPVTCMPADRFGSVTVWAPDAALGDALSTALFILEEDAGLAVVRGQEHVFAVWVLPDGTVHTSETEG